MISTKAIVISNENLKNNIFEIILGIQNMPQIKCGQFVMVDCGSSDGITLKRPISIHNFDENTITLIYRAQGKGTIALSKVTPKKEIDIIMPLGNGFDVSGYKKIAIVGGGLGIFPLFSIIKQYPEIEYHAYLGCRDKCDFVCENKFISSCQTTIIATDDGSLGNKGFVTDFLKNDLNNGFDAIFACGPTPMLKALKKVTMDTEIPVFVSMEQRMGCGFGACLVCTCKTDNGNKRVCADGPIFDLREVEL